MFYEGIVSMINTLLIMEWHYQ